MYQMTIEDILKYFDKISDSCVAIYKGGSRVDPIIENPHDYDYICFAKPLHRHRILTKLYGLGFRHPRSAQEQPNSDSTTSLIDLSQVRPFPYTQITWFSYLDILMEKLIGEDVCPKTDIITEYRRAFLVALKDKTNLLLNNTIKNQKRWYHILRGVYILINNSYEVTEQQQKEINTLHDLTEGWEIVRDKTVSLLKDLCTTEGIS